MVKSRKSLDKSNVEDESMDMGSKDEKVSWEERTKYLTPIAHPLATRKLTKKLFKTVKKAAKVSCLRRGIKEVQKCVKKGEKGILVFAGDVSPVDIISHMPVVCEEAGVEYCFVPSRKELGEAYGSKRSVCMVLIKDHDSYTDAFAECKSKIVELPKSY